MRIRIYTRTHVTVTCVYVLRGRHEQQKYVSVLFFKLTRFGFRVCWAGSQAPGPPLSLFLRAGLFSICSEGSFLRRFLAQLINVRYARLFCLRELRDMVRSQDVGGGSCAASSSLREPQLARRIRSLLAKTRRGPSPYRCGPMTLTACNATFMRFLSCEQSRWKKMPYYLDCWALCVHLIGCCSEMNTK